MDNSKSAIPLIQPKEQLQESCAHIWIKVTTSKSSFIKIRKCAICGAIIED